VEACGSGSDGAADHLQGERFRHAAGIDAVPVPYKDSYIPDLAAGRVSYVVHITAALAPHIRSGKLKGLAVMSRHRIPSLPELPTIVEAGLPDLVYNAGLVLYATGGTSSDVVAQLNRSLNRALTNETVRQRFTDLGLEPTPGSTEDAGTYIVENLALQESMRKLAFPKAP
jgi:tripartite-type tricarboxylate transporter receptor subunit TctC